MAQTIDNWKKRILDAKALEPTLSFLNSSKASVYNSWAYITAVTISVIDNLIDLFTVEVEERVNKSYVGTKFYIREKVLAFQNGDFIQLQTDLNNVNYGNFYYLEIDTDKQIITRVAVTTSVNKTVLIRVAKEVDPIALTNTEKNNLQGYVNTIFPAGIQYIVQSTNADRIKLDAKIYYEGNYSATIQDDVIISLTNYFINLSSSTNFGGTFYLSDLDVAIRNTTGVRNILFQNVVMRTDAGNFATGSVLVQNNTVLNPSYNSVSGYIKEDNVQTFATTLQFIAV
jgi:hypothetical protein